MRSATDQQWWSFTVTADGTYAVRLSELTRNYGLSVYFPSGSSMTTSSGISDRVRKLTLRAGDRVTIKVDVGSGGHSSADPYRLTVEKVSD